MTEAGKEKVTLLQRTTVRTVVVKRNLGGERERKRCKREREWQRKGRRWDCDLQGLKLTKTGFVQAPGTSMMQVRKIFVVRGLGTRAREL